MPLAKAAALVFLFSFFFFPSPALAETPPAEAVVLLVLDELNTSTLLDASGTRINKKRYPAFAHLAKTSTWYRYHSTVADYTARAVPAILTGRTRPYIFADYRSHPESIYSLLGPQYFFQNLEIFTQICPPGTCPPPGPLFLDPLEESPNQFGTRILSSSLQGERRSRWIEGLSSLRENEIHVGHFLSPHGPYKYLPNGQRYKASFALDYKSKEGVVLGNPGLLQSFHKRLLFQLGATDKLLGETISSLKKSNRWNNTLLIVTGDHGLSMKPGFPARDVLRETRYEIGLTPLWVKYPQQQSGTRSMRMTQSDDILPTILRSLGTSNGYAIEGDPLEEVEEEKSVALSSSLHEASYSLDKKEMNEWLQKSSADRARALGDRGLDALGPEEDLIGQVSPDAPKPRRSHLWLKGNPSPRQALLEGFLSRSSNLDRRSTLLLSLRGRFVASSALYPLAGKTSFSFLIHPKYLGNTSPLEIFASYKGKKIRIH